MIVRRARKSISNREREKEGVWEAGVVGIVKNRFLLRRKVETPA
jgi:hypothetical protein